MRRPVYGSKNGIREMRAEVFEYRSKLNTESDFYSGFQTGGGYKIVASLHVLCPTRVQEETVLFSVFKNRRGR